MKRRLAYLLVAVFAFCVGCTPESADNPQSEEGWGVCFTKLMDVCLSGHYYVSAEKAEEYVTFVFSDDESVSMPLDEVKIIDCNIFDEPSIAETSDGWTINLVKTGIPVDKSLSTEESTPVCIWFDEYTLNVVMSNGETVRIGKDPSGSLSSFGFYTKENRYLTKAIICDIDTTSVVGARPVNISTLTLVPRFEYTGVSIKVDGVEQVSGETSQNFSSPVRYDIELFDGSVISYWVSLESANDFPTVYISTTNRRQIQKNSYVAGTIRFEDPKMKYSDVKSLEVPMQIKGRGNATWNNFPKKPYRIKLDEKASVYGLPKNRDWILLANYSDKSLLRNEVAMEVSKICEMTWTPVFYPVEVYLNDSYIGCYDFGDHKEVANHRVDIEIVDENDNDGEDVTGGYYLEIEQQLDEPVSWSTTMGVPMMFKDPEYPTQAQQDYVKGYFNEFERVLQSNAYANAGTGYSKYIDIPSFINYYIVQELTKNIDGNLRKSTFITKERGGKLVMYHVWDFDFALGNCDYFSTYGISGGASDFFIKDIGYQGYGWGWYYRLFQDDVFKVKVKNRWNAVKSRLKTEVPEFIDEQSSYMREAAGRNFQEWDILNTYVWPNRRIPGTYAGEVEYLRTWYLERLEWLDTEINKW